MLARRRLLTVVLGMLAGLLVLVGVQPTTAGAVVPSQWGLTSFCTPSQDFPEFRRFRITNNSGATRDVVLRNQTTGAQVTVTSPPGQTFALVPADPNNPGSANTTQLIVGGVTVNTKAANNKACSTLVGNAVCDPGAGAYDITWTMQNNDTGSSTITQTSIPGLAFTPNPVPANGRSTATERVAAPASGAVVRELTLTVDLGSAVISNPTAAITLGLCGDPIPPTIDFTFTKTPSVTTAEVGETVTYTYAGTNTGEAALEVVQLVDDRLGIVIQEPEVTIVPPGGSLTRSVDYTVQPGDSAIGSIANAAVVTVQATEGPDQEPRTAVANALVTVPTVAPLPEVALVGAAVCDPDASQFVVTWTLANTGPGAAVVTGTSPRDVLFDPDPVPEGESALGSETAAAPATGTTVLSLTVEVSGPGRELGSATAQVTLGTCEPSPPGIGFTFTKSADRERTAAGEVVTYTYSGQNTGDVPLEVVGLVDDRLGVVLQEPEVTLVEPGGTISRSVTYTATLDDAAFGTIDNVAVVGVRDATDPEAPLLAGVAEAVVLVDPVPVPPDPPQPGDPLPDTGGDGAGIRAVLALLLLATGTALVALRRRAAA